MMERLQKILSQAGVASRRASEQLMLDGRVTVNGATVRELGTKADASSDEIRVDGRRITMPERHRYLLLNKPRGYVTPRSDPPRRPTVIDLLAGVRDYVYPVGRLDYDTEGLLILTNDGDLAARLTHPRHGIARVYEAKVLGVPDTHDLDRLSRGVTIEGQRMTATSVRLLPSRNNRHATLQITIHEGRNRQVRNMLEAIGHPVDQLTRIAIGPIGDAKLKLGRWRDLTDAEVKSLKKLSAGAGSQRPQLHQPGPRGHGEYVTHSSEEKKSASRRVPQRRRSG
jgi:23S rRNA pseudouridine2605 synthase